MNLNTVKHSSLATTAPSTFPFGTSMNIKCLNCSYITCSLLYNAQNIFPSAYIYGNHITLYYETNMCKSEHIFFRTHDWLPISPNSNILQYFTLHNRSAYLCIYYMISMDCISVTQLLNFIIKYLICRQFKWTSLWMHKHSFWKKSHYVTKIQKSIQTTESLTRIFL